MKSLLTKIDFKFLATLISIMVIMPLIIGTEYWKFASFIIFLYAFFLLSKNRNGFYLILLAYCLCIPVGIGTSDIQISAFTTAYKLELQLFAYIIPIIFFLFILFKKTYKRNSKNIFSKLILLGCCSLIGYVHTLNINEFISILIILSSSLCIYYFAINDKISLSSYFIYIDVLFYCSFIYTIAEFLFDTGPYQRFYSQMKFLNLEEIGRARGLLGHPLVLSSIVIIYQIVLLARLLLLKEFRVINQICCSICVLLTVSRTTIIIIFVQLILYFILTVDLNKIKRSFSFVLIVIIIGLILYNYWGIYIDNILYRFQHSGASHRYAGYATTWNLFTDNIFGVGTYDVMGSIKRGGYNTLEFGVYFTTIDNFYLKAICAYGIVSILFFSYYFSFIKEAYKHRKSAPNHYKIIFILYISLSMLGLSFNWETIIVSNVFIFSFLGLLMRRLENKSYEE